MSTNNQNSFNQISIDPSKIITAGNSIVHELKSKGLYGPVLLAYTSPTSRNLINGILDIIADDYMITTLEPNKNLRHLTTAFSNININSFPPKQAISLPEDLVKEPFRIVLALIPNNFNEVLISGYFPMMDKILTRADGAFYKLLSY